MGYSFRLLFEGWGAAVLVPNQSFFYWRKYFLICAKDKMSLRFISSMKGHAAPAILVLKQQG